MAYSTLLLWVIAAGACIGLLTVLVTAGGVVLRRAHDRRRAAREDQVRALVLSALRAGRPPDELLALRGSRGRAAERVTAAYLAQLRGAAHDLLADVLLRRGAGERALRRSRRRLPNSRSRAAHLLGLLATPRARERLEQLLRGDPRRRVRVVAARGLGESDAVPAARALLGSVGGGNRAMPSGVVASALLSLGLTAVPELRATAGAWRHTPNPGFAGVERVAAAVDLLGLLKDLTGWERIAAAAASSDPEVRFSAARALGQLGVRQAVPILALCAAPGEDPAVRAAAAWALGRIRDPAGIPALAACLGDPAYPVAHQAALALAALGDPGRQALRALAAGRDGAAAAGHAREALSRPAPPRALRPPAAEPPVIGGPRYPGYAPRYGRYPRRHVARTRHRDRASAA